MSLQQHCLQFVAGRLKDYSVDKSLSRLPTALREQLLLHLPTVDVCLLEEEESFARGVDWDQVWSVLVHDRIMSDEWYGKIYEEMLTPKDSYLNHVFHSLLTMLQSLWDNEEAFSREEITRACLLFGVFVEEDELVLPSLYHTYNPRLSGSSFWVTPQRYSKYLAPADSLILLNQFLERCKWYPTHFKLTSQECLNEALLQDHKLCANSVLQSLLSQVKNIEISMDCRSWQINRIDCHIFFLRIRSLLQAVTASELQSFNSLSIKAKEEGYGSMMVARWLVEVLCGKSLPLYEQNVIFSSRHCYTGLKKIEIVGYSVGLFGAMKSLATLVDQQNKLEVLVFENFSTYRRSDVPEEEFFSYLTQVVCKASLKYLRVGFYFVPLNTIKSMIFTFLTKPVSCMQILDLGSCIVEDECYDVLENYQHIEPKALCCIDGSFKSLSLPIDGPLEWLLSFSNFHLEKLELHFRAYNESCYDDFCEYLMFSQCSVQPLSVKFHNIQQKHASQAIEKALSLPFVVEVGFITCSYGVLQLLLSHLSHISSVIPQPIGLKKLYFEDITFSTHNSTDNISMFFEALAGLPSQLLAELDLEFKETPIRNFIALATAWTAKAQGKKLKSLTYLHHLGFGSFETEVKEIDKDVLLNKHAILEILDDVAVEVKLQILPQYWYGI